MKKLISIVFFILIGTICTYSQDVSLPRDVAEKALKAIELIPALEAENEALRNQVQKLKDSQQTPCSIAINAIKNNLLLLENINTNNLSERDAIYVLKMRKKTYNLFRKSSNKILQSQCNYKDENKLNQILLNLIPLSVLFLK